MKFIKADTRVKPKLNLKIIKTAYLIEMDEEKFTNLLKEIKSLRLFKLLKAFGVIKISKFRRFYISKYSVENFPLVSEENSDISYLLGDLKIVSIIKKLGLENFKKYFLEGGFLDSEIEKNIGVNREDIIKIKDIVSKIFIKETFNKTLNKRIDLKANYCIASVIIKKGEIKPCFHNPSIWDEKMQIDKKKLGEYIRIVDKKEIGKIKDIIEKISLIEYKKSNLILLIEYVFKEQKRFLKYENYDFLNPLTQKSAANHIGVCPSVINRLLEKRYIKLSSGILISLKTLFPSSKKINKIRFKKIFFKNKNLSDRELGYLFFKKYKISLSRRTINQYKNELLNL